MGLFGHENLHQQLRLLTLIEAVKNYSYYTMGSVECRHLMGDVSLVASADTASLFEEIGTLGGWQGVSAFCTASEALHVKLVSYHPVCPLYNFKCDTTGAHGSDDELTIMWTTIGTGHVRIEDFIHFVPKYGSIFNVRCPSSLLSCNQRLCGMSSTITFCFVGNNDEEADSWLSTWCSDQHWLDRWRGRRPQRRGDQQGGFADWSTQKLLRTQRLFLCFA